MTIFSTWMLCILLNSLCYSLLPPPTGPDFLWNRHSLFYLYSSTLQIFKSRCSYEGQHDAVFLNLSYFTSHDDLQSQLFFPRKWCFSFFMLECGTLFFIQLLIDGLLSILTVVNSVAIDTDVKVSGIHIFSYSRYLPRSDLVGLCGSFSFRNFHTGLYNGWIVYIPNNSI